MPKTKPPYRSYKSGLLEWLRASPKNQIEYLKSSIEENSDMPEAILAALRDIAEVRGFEKLAEDSGLSQKSLYKILKASSKPRLETIHQILHALGLRLTIEPIPEGQKVALG